MNATGTSRASIAALKYKARKLPKESSSSSSSSDEEEEREEAYNLCADIEAYKKLYNSTSKPANCTAQGIRFDTGLPVWWKPMGHEDYLVEQIDRHDSEYKKVVTFFDKGTVISIGRIQNPALFKRYQRLKEKMEKRSPNIEMEMSLYHGTSADRVEKINRYGFNKRYCLKTATDFGDGIYFVTNPRLTTDGIICPEDAQGNRYVYLARVLTGTSSKGVPGLRVPPLMSVTSGSRYDSVSGNERSVFVIFSEEQAYPEYLIIFRV